MPPLDIKKTMEELQAMYSASAGANKVNFLLYGDMGTGKTTMAVETCRKPCLLHSFDPGGADSVNPQLIRDGLVFVDNRYERDDAKKPTAFEAWDKEFERLLNGGFFNHIGTFILDSTTTWAQAAMYAVLKKAGRSGGVPQQNDYLPQMTMLENAVKVMCALPCDVILTAHQKADKDEITGKISATPLLTGKLTQRIPLLFNEIYHMVAKETSKGTNYSVQTQACSTYMARTRMGRRGAFEKFEEPDIKYLLKKGGKNYEDLLVG